MTKKSELLPLLMETATTALQIKTRIVRRSLRRDTSRKIYAKQEHAIETAVAKAIVPVVEEQLASVKQGLLDMEGAKSTITSDQAQALSNQVFDPEDSKWKDGLVDKALPVMAVPMLEAMRIAMKEVGVNPTKGLKSNA